MPPVKTVFNFLSLLIIFAVFCLRSVAWAQYFVSMSNVNMPVFFLWKFSRFIKNFSPRSHLSFDAVGGCLRWYFYWKFWRVCFWKWNFVAAILNLFVSLMIFISGNSTLYIVVCCVYLVDYLVFRFIHVLTSNFLVLTLTYWSTSLCTNFSHTI